MLYESKIFDRNTDFPSQFEAIIDAPDNGGDAFVVCEAAKHIKGLLTNPPKRSSEAKLLYLDYADGFFNDCLIDFDGYPGLWRENAREIEDLIEQAEHAISTPHYSTTYERPPVRATLNSFHGRMIAYHAINDAFLGKFGEFKTHIEAADRISRANVLLLMEENENCSSDGWRVKIELASQPLLIVSRADLEGRYARLLTETLDAYRTYLEQLDFDIEDCMGIFQKIEGLSRLTEGCDANAVPASENKASSGFLPPWGAPRLRNYVVFGRDHGGEPLKWIALDVAEGKTLLLSDKILDVHAYAQEDAEACLWENGDLREFISGELVFDLFTSAERAYIDGVPRIMRALEIERCFPRDEDRISYGTAYANSHGLMVNASGAGGYWTSTPGEKPCCMAFVRPDGDIDTQGCPQDETMGLGVRLALTLKVDVNAYSRRRQLSENDDAWDGVWLEDDSNTGDTFPFGCGNRPESLSDAEIAILRALSDFGEARVSDLAQYVEFPVSKAYNVLVNLEGKDLVEKTVSKKRLLTPAGIKALRGVGCC